ncbi:MAG TPA: hypothetical protein VKV04_18590 [Verrucomicrobiae bacterium]|nr:hypothetical protein [Verrucomicrobiae bacterium]
MRRFLRGWNLAGCGALGALGLALAGCNRDQVKVQEVPKEADSPPQVADAGAAPAMPVNPHAGMDMSGGAAQPQVKWTLPPGWQQKASGQMEVGSFAANDKDGHNAQVSIVPLPSGGPEMELAIYNMWRTELQLPAAQKAESEPVTVGSAQGKLYQLGDDKSPGRMVVAVLEKDGFSWYFKMAGESSAVDGVKPAFLDFLKSISFEAAPATAMVNPHASMGADPMAPAEAAPVSVSGLPAGWQEIPNPPMLLAKYVIQGADTAKAEVNISRLAGTGGGLLKNVNRWRGQLGLSEFSDDDVSKQAQTIDWVGGKATVVDFTGTDKTGKSSRLIGIIAPQMDQTWFYKLMGDPQIVEQQKDTFRKFIQTSKFANNAL